MTQLLASLAAALPSQTGEGGMFQAFLHSGPMAKVVLGTLALFSIASWTVIFGKLALLRRAKEQNRRFLEAFHRSKRFSDVNAVSDRLRTSPLVGIFQAGYAEIDAQIKTATQADPHAAGGRYVIRSLDAVERSLRRASQAELQTLAKNSQLLATTAAATPFIGLFGTVWGIMIAFGDIGATGSTSIVTVAPGIAEALINTAAGLAAAIPALIGYNYFAQRLREQRAQMEDFILEFINLAERNFT
ncbi:MAG: MotA/TolQ/ExbB proton channel family protein [Acidobacteria bacterium]|nr:MotA/TolQ/ExbB proton channel family protein [Acidobacteriota bacterium]